MKVVELIPAPKSKVPFKLSSYKLVPREHGCYVLTTFEGEIIYIGMALNLSNRFKQHLDNKEKTDATQEGKAIWYYFMSYNRNNLPKLERTWLNEFLNIHGRLPTLNKVNAPVR